MTAVNDTLAEDRRTIARRLKGCAERREVPTWAEIAFAADALLDAVPAERERCARIAEAWHSPYGGPRDAEVKQAIADAIRSGEVP